MEKLISEGRGVYLAPESKLLKKLRKFSTGFLIPKKACNCISILNSVYICAKCCIYAMLLAAF